LTRTFNVAPISADEIRVSARTDKPQVRVLTMAVTPQQIFVRKRLDVSLPVRGGRVLAESAQDVQYVTVVERYGRTGNRPTAFVSGFGLKSGALASSAAPDDNNIVCVGENPEDMVVAINHIIANNGGQVVVEKRKVVSFLPLPIGGIVADLEPVEMALRESELDGAARALGCRLPWPFMYMFVLQITAIPDYAITDLGPIDCVNLKVFDPVTAAL
jgi:adenine deaminase